MSALSIRTSGLAPSKFKRWLLVAILTGFGAAAVAFFVCEYAATHKMRLMIAASDAELLWLRREFNLLMLNTRGSNCFTRNILRNAIRCVSELGR
jgi:hypothetical protein